MLRRTKTIFGLGYLLSILILSSCSNSKSIQQRDLLAGYWVTSKPMTPNIIIDDASNVFVILEDSASADTLSFTYTLKGNLFTLYTAKLWISKNRIVKLDKDRLVYVRVGDKERFYYRRRRY